MLAQADYELIIVLLIVLGSIAFTIGLFWLIAAFGWRQWARAYPDRPLIEGKIWRWNSLSFERGASYNNAVTITATRTGLRLRLPLLLRAGHPTIFVPWTELSISRAKKRLMGEVARLETRKTKRALLLPAGIANRIAEHVGNAWIEVDSRANADGAQTGS